MVAFSTNKGYFLPRVGGDPNVWGGYLNDTTDIIDTNLGGTATVSVAGNADVVATAPQAQNLVQKLTGALTGSINYILPATGGFYIVDNATTGAHTVTVITSHGGSTGPIVPQGTAVWVWSDGTNVYPGTPPQSPTQLTPPAWHDVSGSRAINTNYTNMHPYPITVSVTAASTMDGQYAALTIDGNDVVAWNLVDNGKEVTLYGVVAPGSVYSASVGTLTITKWFEFY